jgi:transcriptional regulator with XRE-family HTH domain
MNRPILAILGFKTDSPVSNLARELVKSDRDFITRLIELRKEAGLTQEDVAEKLGVSQPAISDFERVGGDPRLSTIRRYALAIGARVHHHATPVERFRDPSVLRELLLNVSFESDIKWQEGSSTETRRKSDTRALVSAGSSPSFEWSTL